MAAAVKYAFSQKMSFGSPRIDFELILRAFWVPGGALNEEKLVSGGGRKKCRFLRALFSRLWPILGVLEGSKVRSPLPFFRFFSNPGGYFFCSGVIFGHFDGLLCFGAYFGEFL